MVKNFFRIINTFDNMNKIQLYLLFTSCVFAGILETMGVILIFPFMLVINDPSAAINLPILNDLYEILNLSSPEFIIYLLALAIGGIFIFKNLYMLVHNYLEFGLIMRWKNDLRLKFMKYYLSESYLYHVEKTSAKLMSRLENEINIIFKDNILQMIVLISNLVILVSLSLLILYLMFLPTLAAFLVLAILIFIQIRFVRRYGDAVKDNLGKAQISNLNTLQKGIFAIKETKIFQKEKSFLEELEKNDEFTTRQEKLLSFITYLPPHITEMILICAIILMTCLIVFIEGVSSNSLSYLGILALTSFRIAPLINRISYSYGQIRASSKVFENVLPEIEAIKTKSGQFEKVNPLPFRNEIMLENVFFSYSNNGLFDLKNINISILKGEFIGIIGPSGAGKTSLVNIIMALINPTAGDIYLDNRKITKSLVRRYVSNISFVSQNPYIFNGSIAQNVAFGEREHEIDWEKLEASLRSVDLLGHFLNQPRKLNTILGDNASRLSGGQRQRVALARALYHNSGLLILDEATSALDVETEKVISDLIQKLTPKKTVISIAHRLSTLKNCDRIFYMEKGKISAVGTFNELYNTTPKVRKLIDLSTIKLS